MGNHLGYEYDEDKLKQGINLEIQKFEVLFENYQYINMDIYKKWRQRNEQIYDITKLKTIFSKVYKKFNKIYEDGEFLVNSHNLKIINELYSIFINKVNGDVGYFSNSEYVIWKEEANNCIIGWEKNIEKIKNKKYINDLSKLESLVVDSNDKRKEYNKKYIHFIKNTKEAINDLRKNKYINKKVYREWLEKYKYTFLKLNKVDEIFTTKSDFESIKRFINIYNSYDEIEVYNKDYINKEKEQYKDIFDDINGISLDDNQREVIIKDEINHLVVAGAGCGKTTLICGKVMYLLKRYNVLPEEILLISYSNKAVDEMNQRLSMYEELKNINVSTMHKLGKNIISKVQKDNPRVIDSVIMYNIVKEKFYDCIRFNENFRSKIVEFYSKYYYSIGDIGFKNQNEFLKYLRENNKIKTIKGEIVRSFEELEIANFLYVNGVEYKYEKKYEKNQKIRTDFYLPKYDIYMEHFGVDKNNNPAYFFKDRESYKNSMEQKIKMYKSFGTVLITTSSSMKREGILLQYLKEELNLKGVKFNKLTDNQIIKQIEETIKYQYLVNLLYTVLSHVKADKNNYKKLKEQYKKNKNLNTYTSCRVNIFIEIFDYIYDAYKIELENDSSIDFGDMINLATNYVKENKYQNKYKYIIIDEIQDISNGTYRFIKSLLEDNKNCRLFCVGDDWQSIYRFSGSNINLFYNFENLFEDIYVSYMTNTYRFDKSLVDISNQFIMLDKSNLDKKVVSYKSYLFGEQCKFTTNVIKILDEIGKKENYKKVSVYILGRYKNDRDKLKNEKNRYLSVYPNDNIVYKKNKNLDIKFLTIHQAKGMEADYVIILNCEDSNKNNKMKGFPTNIQDDPILDIILPKSNKHESYSNQNSEERRLFYVAMTRAKKQVFLNIPKKEENRSIYVKEIEDIKGKLENYIK